jgi:hypothetical protein
MGIEILRGVDQSPKSRPCRRTVGHEQGCQYETALFVDVTIGRFQGVIVEVIFIVPNLSPERVLPGVGRADDCKRTWTEAPVQSFASDLNMDLF